MQSKKAILQGSSFGEPVAEHEMQKLSQYFVETEQWNKLLAGEKDIVYGPKGSGKSALYSLLLQKKDDLFDRGILIKPGETPRGTPAFRAVANDPPEDEDEFVALWKLYFLCLIAEILREYGVETPEARRVYRVLSDASLLDLGPLQALLAAVRKQVAKLSRASTVEAGVAIDPSGALPVVATAKVKFDAQQSRLVESIADLDFLMADADQALSALDFSVWIVIDRLDVAFPQNSDLERLALRALFHAYNDMQSCEKIALKLFLRTDIWKRVAAGGFREASHISRRLTITWQRQSLMHLVIRRLLTNEAICAYYRVDPEVVSARVAEQEALVLRMLPEQVDRGKNPSTFDWMLSRTQDGTGATAPRELIQLLDSLKAKELERIELGHDEPPEETLFSPSSFKQALRDVSEARLTQTLYAEYPELQPFVESLRGEKTQQTIQSLASLWGLRDRGEVRRIASHLVDVGFFEDRGNRSEPVLWVPFLYRDALNMSQGEARSFSSFGSEVIDVLSSSIPEMLADENTEGRRGTSRGDDLWLTFIDQRTRTRLTLWCFAADAKAGTNFRGRPPIIGIGLMHDSSTELDQKGYQLRLKDSGFRWYTHISGTQGFRLITEVADYASTSPENVARAVVGRLLRALQRARLVV